METILNSTEMKTVVETFVVEETVDLIYDNDKLLKWNELVNKLELKGQTQIVKPEKSPIPFMHLKKGMANVFKTLCPVETNVSEYSISPIPLEILDLIGLSKKEEYFREIQIWYDDRKPDPVCIGINYEGYVPRNTKGWEWNQQQKTYEEALALCSSGETPYCNNPIYYILGKWADVKHTFDELKEMAVKRYTEDRLNSINQEMKRLEREKEDLNNSAFNQFN